MITPKKHEMLMYNLPKHVQNLHAENCKTLMTDIKKDKINGKMFRVHELGDSIL